LQSTAKDRIFSGALQSAAKNCLPIQIGDPEFPIVQYADDTLLILPADSAELAALKSLLVNFTATTGLAVNYRKSCMLPINATDEELQ
jgi:hypothetical protein